MTRHVQAKRAFALVLTLLLIVILASTGAGLAATVGAQRMLSSRGLLNLQHELAVDSVLVALRDADKIGQQDRSESSPRRLDIKFGRCRARAELTRESGKRFIRTGNPETTAASLRELARAEGLPEEDIRLQPVHESEQAKLGAFLWFGQIIAPSQFEEIFRWRFEERDRASQELRKCWSDLISFWSARGTSLEAVELETYVGHDIRRWYLVVARTNGHVRVYHRSLVE